MRGAREEDIVFDPKRVIVLVYPCAVDGARAIENTRQAFNSSRDCAPEQFVIDAKKKVVEDGAAERPIQQDAGNIENGVFKICSLFELKKGDHIREDNHRLFKHHLLVVEVLSVEQVRVIHKVDSGVVEENKLYSCPSELSVCRYHSPYNADEIIDRARNLPRGAYSQLWSNCEHFVKEIRTGERQSEQLRMAGSRGGYGLVGGCATGAATGAGIGAAVGLAPGAAVGAGVGAAVGAVAGLIGGGVWGVRHAAT